MDDSAPAFCAGCLVGLMVALLVMMLMATPSHIWQRQAIQHGAAQYNQTTGKFEWIDRKEAEDE